jgi:hypothetical protein
MSEGAMLAGLVPRLLWAQIPRSDFFMPLRPLGQGGSYSV